MPPSQAYVKCRWAQPPYCRRSQVYTGQGVDGRQLKIASNEGLSGSHVVEPGALLSNRQLLRALFLKRRLKQFLKNGIKVSQEARWPGFLMLNTRVEWYHDIPYSGVPLGIYSEGDGFALKPHPRIPNGCTAI